MFMSSSLLLWKLIWNTTSYKNHEISNYENSRLDLVGTVKSYSHIIFIYSNICLIIGSFSYVTFSHSNGGMGLHSLPVSGGNGLQEERSLFVIQGLTVYNKVSLFNQCNKMKSIRTLITGRRERKRAVTFDMYHFMQKNFFFCIDQFVCQSMEDQSYSRVFHKKLFSNLVRKRSHRMLFAQQPY